MELRLRALASGAWAVGQERVMTQGLEPTYRWIIVAAVSHFVCQVCSEPLWRVSRFIRCWKYNGASTGSYCDAAGRGSRSTLTPDMINAAFNIVVNGWSIAITNGLSFSTKVMNCARVMPCRKSSSRRIQAAILFGACSCNTKRRCGAK